MTDRQKLKAERRKLRAEGADPSLRSTTEKLAARSDRLFELDIMIRTRALHKLDLRPGDVIRLDAWQDGDTVNIGRCYTVNASVSRADHGDGCWFRIPSPVPKGERPLFVIVSRADVAPEKVPNLIERVGGMPDSGQPSRALWEALNAANALIRDRNNASLRADYERLIK